MRFRNRAEAGRQLGEALRPDYDGRSDVLVLGLPRGGVPVAAQVASILRAPLDVFVVRKLGAPGREELALGAIASGGATVFNRDVVTSLQIPQFAIDHVIDRERRELERREREYRGDRPALSVRGLTVILVDDGLATGATMRAAVQAIRALEPAKIVVAAPAASPSTCDRLREVADEVECLYTPEPFYAVSAWYEDFSQVSDEEVSQSCRQQVGRFK